MRTIQYIVPFILSETVLNIWPLCKAEKGSIRIVTLTDNNTKDDERYIQYSFAD